MRYHSMCSKKNKFSHKTIQKKKKKQTLLHNTGSISQKVVIKKKKKKHQNGKKQILFVSYTHLPIFGKVMWYSVPHCGQLTALLLFPFCFSSSQRCRHDWWIHLVQPLHLHGLTHSALRSSRSVAKHTQQCLEKKQSMSRVYIHQRFVLKSFCLLFDTKELTAKKKTKQQTKKLGQTEKY